jgi:3-methyladenine DNA glycosylase AlkD
VKVNSINQSQYAAIVAELKEALRQNADNAVADSMQRFFTEHVNCLGVKMPQITSVINGFHQKHDTVSAPQILAISNEYLQSAEYNEDVFVGYGLVRRHIKQYDEQFIFQMRDWIERYASNWAHVDDLWLLKVTSQYYPEQVLQFIDMHKPNFQRLTINYALEKYDNSVKQKFR